MPSCPGCTDDVAGWKYDSGANNVAVINAFENELGAQNYLRGIYTSPGEWNAIPGFISGNPDIGTRVMWFSSFGPSQSQLTSQEQIFTSRNYTIFSWQYATDVCEMTYASAQSEASGASPVIPKFDKWTPSNPQQVC